MIKKLEDVLLKGEQLLNQAGIEEWKIDAWYLFAAAFTIDRAAYLMRKQDNLSKQQEVSMEHFFEYINERIANKPIQYILNYQEFMGLPFYVDERVLIPRQDTEVLIEEILRLEQNNDIILGDVCTGSGCIAISLKKLGGFRKVFAADISSEALAVAKANSERNQSDVEFFQGDLLTAFDNQKFDVIVSNPPYIESAEIARLAREVRYYEPVLALDGSDDGLIFYQRIVADSGKYLKQGGRIYFEIGYNQGQAVVSLLEAAGYQEIEVIKDLAGKDRVVRGRLSGR